MEETLYFLIRYIPFWGVPMIFISAPAAYVYWLKDVRGVSYSFLLVAFLCLLCVAFWVWAGGPDHSVQYFQDFVYILFN